MKIKNNEPTSLAFDFGLPYYEFFSVLKRYKIIKGSRASMKSTNVAAYMLLKLLRNTASNGICLRKSYNSIKTSVFNQLQKSARMMGVYELFKWSFNPLGVKLLSTGQQIFFSGLMDAESLTSITPDNGSIDTIWIEEAYEIRDEETWIKVEGTFRGVENIEFIITFNPWNKCWLYDTFFKGRLEDDLQVLEAKGYQEYQDDKHLLMINNHRINKHLTKDDHYAYTKLRNTQLHMYNVVSLGAWGNVDQQVYNTITDENYIDELAANRIKFDKVYIGVDFGLKNDATAISVVGIHNDKKNPKVVILDEWKWTNKGKKHLFKNIQEIAKSCVIQIRSFAEKYQAFLTHRTVYVENQEGGGFKTLLRAESENAGLNFNYRDCKKAKIAERIIIFKYLFGENIMLFSTKCKHTSFEFKASTYDLDKLKRSGIFKRMDGADDLINACEYAFSGVWNWLMSHYLKAGKGA